MKVRSSLLVIDVLKCMIISKKIGPIKQHLRTSNVVQKRIFAYICIHVYLVMKSLCFFSLDAKNDQTKKPNKKCFTEIQVCRADFLGGFRLFLETGSSETCRPFVPCVSLVVLKKNRRVVYQLQVIQSIIRCFEESLMFTFQSSFEKCGVVESIHFEADHGAHDVT